MEELLQHYGWLVFFTIIFIIIITTVFCKIAEEGIEIFPNLTFACCQSQREQSRNNYPVLVFIAYWEHFFLEVLIPVDTPF